jgi:hypothetical protein
MHYTAAAGIRNSRRRTYMVALLFTAIFIIGLLATALYLWAPRAKNSEQGLLPPPSAPRGLFSDGDGIEPAALPSEREPELDRETARDRLRERTTAGDLTALTETRALRDQSLYNELLDEFTAAADRPTKLLSLVSYITRNDLPINRRLAEAVIAAWRISPDRSSTATTLHLAALADDADLYRSTVEMALDLWRQGLLPNVTSAELRALFDGEFWVLSAKSRNSGAGFILKRTLTNARHELETAVREN